MERRQAERSSLHGGGRTRIAAGGIATGGEPLSPRRVVSSDNCSDSLATGTDLPASPEASQRGGLMARLAPLVQARSDAGTDQVTSGAVQGLVASQAALRGGRRVVHTLRAAPGKLNGNTHCCCSACELTALLTRDGIATPVVGVHGTSSRPCGPSPTPPSANASPVRYDTAR